jgi:cytochrome c-type biogenesis protein CcmH/NrfF
VNGWFLWGLVLPVLLVVAGIVSMQRRNRRPCGTFGAESP